jgi:hypothetical protein
MPYQFYYSGPLLYHTELNKDDLKNLKKICIKDKTKDAKNRLAGHLDHEYMIDTKVFSEILKNYLLEYSQGFDHWYGKKIKSFKTIMSWVNFMKAGDFNPPHVHSDFDLTCVLYLDIPLKLQEENKKFIGKGSGPGSINFIFQTGNDKFNISSKNYFPKTGDFFIFPASLLHSVSPFKSNVERISVSANFKIEII